MSAQAKHVEQELIVAGEIKPIQLDGKLLAEVNQVRADIALMAAEYATLPDVTTKEGMALAVSRKTNVVSLRTRGKEAVKAYTKPMYDGKKLIDDMWRDQILIELTRIEDPLSAAINAEKNRVELERQADEKRKARIQEHIAYFHATPGTLITLESIDAFTETLDSTEFEDFDEFAAQATIAINKARKVCTERRAILQSQATREAELLAQQAKQAAEQKKLDEQAAELARERAKLKPEPQPEPQTPAAPSTPPPRGTRSSVASFGGPVGSGQPIKRAPAEPSAAPVDDFHDYMAREVDCDAIRAYLLLLAQVPMPASQSVSGSMIIANIQDALRFAMEDTGKLIEETMPC